MSTHPAWCSRSRCIAGAGYHESDPVAINVVGKGHPPQVLLMLAAPGTGAPVKVRLTTVGDMTVHEIGLDLSAARAVRDALSKLLALTIPTQPPPPDIEGFPVGGRH